MKTKVIRKAMALTALLVSGALLGTPMPSYSADQITLTVGYQPYDTISYSAAVIRALGLWKKYLPPNVKVEFQSALQGSIIVNGMVAGKQQIGYLGDMPAVVSTTKTAIAPIKLVANLGYSAGQRCNVVMLRKNAPEFKNPKDAVKWLDGKIVATPRGSCADRFLRTVIAKTGIKPKQILNQSIEVIATNFRINKIDGATLWEPTVSRLGDFVGQGIAKEVATGYNYNEPDAGFLAMRADFVKDHPKIAKAWLRTELEAQRFILDPKNWDQVAKIVESQTTGITPAMAWFSIYGKIPAQRGGSPIRDEKVFVFDSRIKNLIRGIYVFLHSAQVINVDKAPAGAIDDSLARQVVKEVGAPTPLGVIVPQPASKAPKS